MDTARPARRFRRVLAVACAFGLVLALSAVGGPASLADQIPETATAQSAPPDHSNAADPPGQDPETLPRGQDDDFVPPGQDPGTTPGGQDEDFVPPGQDEDFTPPGQDEDFVPPGQGDVVPGNRGTIKVQDPGTGAEINANQPHQGCTFEVAFFGFPEGTVNVSFAAQPPTGTGVLGGVGGPVTTVEGVDTSASYNLSGALGDFEPHPQQGFHVKVTVTNPALKDPGNRKHKVFWLDCGDVGGGGNGGNGNGNGGNGNGGNGNGNGNGNGGNGNGGNGNGEGDEAAGGEGVTPPADQVAGVDQVTPPAPGEDDGDVLSGDQQRPEAPGEAGADHRHVVDHDGHGPHEHPHEVAHGNEHEHVHDHEHVAAGAVSDQEAVGIVTPTRVDAGGGGMAGGESSVPAAPILASMLWVLGMGYLRRIPKPQRAA